jgi:starch synthase (maltosyl-transferring)
LLLATTLLPLYGIYSGFELCENVPVREGSEEYLDSEKYQIRPRDYCAPGNINADIRRLNTLRRDHGALQQYANLSFHTSENPAILFYRKAARAPVVQWTGQEPVSVPPVPLAEPSGTTRRAMWTDGEILVAVNTDPLSAQDGMVHVPVERWGLATTSNTSCTTCSPVRVTRGVGSRNYVRLDPAEQPGHLLRVERLSTS